MTSTKYFYAISHGRFNHIFFNNTPRSRKWQGYTVRVANALDDSGTGSNHLTCCLLHTCLKPPLWHHCKPIELCFLVRTPTISWLSVSQLLWVALVFKWIHLNANSTISSSAFSTTSSLAVMAEVEVALVLVDTVEDCGKRGSDLEVEMVAVEI